MTWQKFAEEFLSDLGMMPETVALVMAYAIEHRQYASMRNRWQQNIAEYPAVMQEVILQTLRPVALEWIDAHEPGVWYRDSFQS